MTSIFWREQDDDQLVPICVLHTCSAPGHSVGSCCEVVLQRKAVQEEGRDEGSVAAIAPTTSPVLLLHPNCTAVLAYRWTLADLELAPVRVCFLGKTGDACQLIISQCNEAFD